MAELARSAADGGATALGVAGGDGSLAAVATVAVDADVPFLPVPFGTRNHFARDAGFEVDDRTAGELFDADTVERCELDAEEHLFLCRAA